MDKKKLNKMLDFLYQYKMALIEKIADKVNEFCGQDDEVQYSLGNFAVEDFMDNHAMRLSHLNVLLMELQHHMDTEEMRYERLATQVYEIPKSQLKHKIKYYLDSLPPSSLEWVHLEKVSDEEYYLIITRKVEA
ncbi:MAG: hypothetical protein D6785_12430 [Planctomycetota bacterium]|nr:MAG: hypothetical protein D6785_12430 [Planctomycetota bacterium]